ncbi:DUF5719 family protein [Thermostaphylospora chromogena]|uniref:DUF5719 family protein n=1 Tax=Thermostaphylospora chromogena TaxID=35622 RepID=UPI001F605CA3|nr:DUF5719 family protein [Thermostaphylospora chromogena]
MRVVETALRALIENRFGMLGLVVVSLLALYGVAYATRPAPAAAPAPQPSRVPVESVTAVCPDLAGAAVSVVAPGQNGKSGQKGAGEVAVTELGEDGEPVGTLTETGRLWQKTPKGRTGPLLVAGDGAVATGLEAAQTGTQTSGALRGLAGVRCVEPSASAWLVGPGPAAADVTLYLANADSAPASVRLAVYAGEGTVLDDHGLVLEPGEHRAIPLKDLAPSPLIMAVEVRTSKGRVAVAARAAMSGGRGVDWLPQAAPPATRVVVPGIPGGGGKRELYVAAPGELDAVVSIKAVTADGAYAMKNRETLEVPAGSVASLDLTTGIGGQAAALVLTSETPVVAGMTVTATGSLPDVAFSAGAGPIDLGSVVADNRASGGDKPDKAATLVLTAPEKAGRVRVTVIPARGSAPKPLEVSIPAARTREVELPAARGPFSVALTPLPGSGPVYGGRVLTDRLGDGLLITLQPLAPARVWTLVPPLTDSPVTVLP